LTLYRSRNHKLIAGVCGGLADWLGWDVFLPTTTGTGEAYVYVTAGAVLTNLQAVTINP